MRRAPIVHSSKSPPELKAETSNERERERNSCPYNLQKLQGNFEPTIPEFIYFSIKNRYKQEHHDIEEQRCMFPLTQVPPFSFSTNFQTNITYLKLHKIKNK